MRRAFVVLVIVGVVWAAAGMVAAGAEPRQQCLGRDATLDMRDLTPGEPGVGTRGDDVILGTDGDDRIVGLGGDDRICGEGGDDNIRGGPGADTIDAGSGDDTARGGPGDDVIRGGVGDDPVLNGGNGDDEVYGEAGDDGVFGGPDDDYVDGGPGNDGGVVGQVVVILGGSGDDVMLGGPGIDKLRGGAGNDVIDAGDGIDWVFGGGGADVIDGGPGDDVLEGNTGADELYGGDGDDLLKGLKDPDELHGEAGEDTLLGGDGDDSLDGGDGDDVLLGENGHDALAGGAGDDTLNGTPGTDTDNGGAGIDACHRDDARTGCEQAGGCLRSHAEPELVLERPHVEPWSEPFITAWDFDGDGDDDFAVTRLRFQTDDEYPLQVFLNQGGGLVEGTPGIFTGSIPTVQHPAEVVVADFNGDGRDDVFVADSGRDINHPGYQNSIALSAPGGRLVDGTPGLPQQNEVSHSAATGDVDGDGDLDLYVGNIWGGENDGHPPQIWLNDGSARFSVAEGRIPEYIAERNNGAFTTSLFVDVDNDGDSDLVLGAANFDPARGQVSVVLVNDGSGWFSVLSGAMPARRSARDIGHDIVAGDLDRDGYGDLIVVYEAHGTGGEPRGSYLQLLRNRGDGRFEDVSGSRMDPLTREVWIRTLDMYDLDRDGDLDLLARPWDYGTDPGTGPTRSDPIVWINRGGDLTLIPMRFGVPNLYFDFLDFDGDGGLDVIAEGWRLVRERGSC